MKMTLRFCSTFAVALSLIIAARAQQNPAPAAVPEPAAPAAPATTAAPAAPAVAPADTTSSTNKVTKPKAKKKAAAKKKTTVKKAAPSTGSTNETVKAVSRVEINPPQTGLVKQDAINVRGRPSFV